MREGCLDRTLRPQVLYRVHKPTQYTQGPLIQSSYSAILKNLQASVYHSSKQHACSLALCSRGMGLTPYALRRSDCSVLPANGRLGGLVNSSGTE